MTNLLQYKNSMMLHDEAIRYAKGITNSYNGFEAGVNWILSKIEDPTPSKEESSNGSIDSEEGFTKGELTTCKLPDNNHVLVIYHNDGKFTPICYSHLSGDKEEGKANAARIVKCWNEHDGLVKVLTELLEQFEKVVDPKFTLDEMIIRDAKSILHRINKH